MKDCERCKNHKICKLEVKDSIEKCPFIHEIRKEEYAKGYNQGNIDRAEELQKCREYGYNKAIDDFFDELQRYKCSDDWLRLKMSSIYQIAEELKAGGVE